ncbi:UPF0187-domain-containing protein [Suillus paluster]|uniref:UPF0187-domain-containing protein n=1 Tax=Suillus paluster TaxID=48578 RepID=UPI001B875AB5|nr:UPF0187-domain-containing protein [Suillus paluster]KAG1756294.1 UPF0187-domain-containing protein [Suillus paluster]
MESRRSVNFTLAALKSPRIKRKYLRKYSWLPDVLRVKGSIIGRIIGPVLTVTIFAALVAYAWSKGKRVALTNSVVPLLSVVVGLILVFRNGTSYDRYWEGRKCFSSITSNVRNLSRNIWVNVSLPPTENHPAHTSEDRNSAILRSFCICCPNITFAMKTGPVMRTTPVSFPPRSRDSTILVIARVKEAPLLLPIMLRRQLWTEQSNNPDATKRIRPKRSKKQLVAHTTASGSTTPLLSDSHQTVEFHPYADRMSMPFPLIIAHELSSAIFRFKREVLVLILCRYQALNAMSGIVQSMVDQMTSMERVANTPIPAPYGIHLKQCVTLYLFALPLTLISDLGWSTIPIVTVVAFTLMGIEGIADEIEMPFGHDPHDLPLDTYCDDLREEIEFMIERLPEGGHGVLGYDDGEGDD